MPGTRTTDHGGETGAGRSQANAPGWPAPDEVTRAVVVVEVDVVPEPLPHAATSIATRTAR